MPSFRRHGKSDNMTLCAVGAMVMLTGVLLYMSMLLSPALFRGIIQDVVCDHQKQEYVGGGTDAQQRSLLQLQALTVAEMNRTHVVVEAEGRDHAHILIEASQVTVDCNCPACTGGSAMLRSRAGDASHKKVSILIGIFTTAPRAERRNLLRLAYGVQHSEHALVTVKFVVGRVKNSEEKILLGMEILHHNDVLVLDCEESINDGKSFTFFSTLAAQGTKYDYVMKADDDSYLRLDNLGRSLYRLPRIDVYYGYILPCENTDPHAWYMAGMGYVLSWDLVQWIHKSPIPRENSVGTEDQLIADWFNAGKKAKNRVNKKPLFYDHPDFGGQCSHELVPETILVHQVKTQERWINVLSYFEEQRMVDLFRSTTQDSQPPS